MGEWTRERERERTRESGRVTAKRIQGEKETKEARPNS